MWLSKRVESYDWLMLSHRIIHVSIVALSLTIFSLEDIESTAQTAQTRMLLYVHLSITT